MKFRDFNLLKRKNFVIFSLVMMLGLFGYINYNLINQSLLETSSELERYEMKLMEESGVLNEILDEEELAVGENSEDFEGNGEELENQETVEGELNQTTGNHEEEMDNAIIVDSRENDVIDVAKETNAQITKLMTSKEIMQSNAYFIESKIQRDKKRSEMVSYLNSIVDNQYSAGDVRNQAQNMKLQLITNTEKELMIENMITAKGFNDVIVYLSDQRINIVVQSSGLNEKDVAQIVDIVRRETEISMDNIIIMNKK